MNYTDYIRVVGDPQQGNWIRYMDWLSNDDVIVSISVFSTSLSPSLGILTIPITFRPRLQHTRTIVGGGVVNGIRSTPKIKQVPYRWEFEKTSPPELLTDEDLIRDFGRTFCNLILTESLVEAIDPTRSNGLKEAAAKGVNHNHNWEHYAFLHQVIAPSAKKALETASLQFKLLRDTTRSTRDL